MYADLLIKSQRAKGQYKDITVIAPDRRHEFFVRLKADQTMNPKMKALLCVCISGGARITESLNVRLCDLDLRTGLIEFGVLKKRAASKAQSPATTTSAQSAAKKIRRKAKLHPIALEIVREYVKQIGFRSYEYIFDVSRQYAHKYFVEKFGEGFCPHSCRHSHISWLLHEKKLPVAKVARLMSMHHDVVYSYSHVNTEAELHKLDEDFNEVESSGVDAA